jgi:hypothetical protein
MSKLNITYYRQLGEIHVDEDNLASDHCDINFNITDREEVGDCCKTAEDTNHPIDISALSVEIAEDNGKFPTVSFPNGVTYKTTDQFYLFGQRITWNADDEINLTIKVGDITKKASLVVPRPEQPYKSWTWENNQWNAPTKYPDDENEYIWNEEKLNWELN